MKAKEKAKHDKTCDSCTLQGSAYCRECYNFGLYNPKAKTLDCFPVVGVASKLGGSQ